VRKAYPRADFVDPYAVFNIEGGACRLIMKIECRWRMVFAKHLLRDEEYEGAVTPAEERLIALLILPVEEYEAKTDPVPEAGPLDIIRHRLGAHRLRPKDLWMYSEPKLLFRTL
jgi:hypothetical protein